MITYQENFVEQCWFIYGLRIRYFYIGFLKYHSKGTVGSVGFDWHKVLTPFLIGWYHSHPGVKALTPSITDNKTMRSWVVGLDKPFLCGIFCSIYQKCYCYYKSDRSTRKNTVVCRRPVASFIKGPFFLGVYQKNEYGITV